MTEPFTTPTPVPQDTVLPRNPDGSPLPKAKAEEKLEEQDIADVIEAMARVAKDL